MGRQPKMAASTLVMNLGCRWPSKLLAWNWQAEHDDPNSVWTFYQTLCRLRNASPLRADLIEGDFAPLNAHNDNVIAYARGQHVQILRILARSQPQLTYQPVTFG